MIEVISIACIKCQAEYVVLYLEAFQYAKEINW